MRISYKFYPNPNLFRYCLSSKSLSPKTLIPKALNSAPPSNSVVTIFSSRHSSSVLIQSESRPFQKRPVLCNSSSGSSSIHHFGLRLLQIKLSSSSSSSGLASDFLYNPFLPQKHHFLGDSLCGLPSKLKIGLFTSSTHISHYHNVCRKRVRFYTVSSSSSDSKFDSCSVVESEVRRKNYRGKFVLEVVDMIRNNVDDLESRLNKLQPRLNTYSITEIFEVLNSQKVAGLRFFEWVRSSNPKLGKNACVCSLIIDNLGRLEDYGTMHAWLRIFACENICLTYEAFGFLPVLATTDASLKESTETVLGLLSEVGGSYWSSGVSVLIEMFCKFHLFEMARHVIKIAGGKESYYRLLIREKCKSGLVEDARDIIGEMREAGFAPTTVVYNYILGSLWKHSRIDEASGLLDEMKENDIPLDDVTFEILINSACSLGNMDTVHRLLGEMVARALLPRLSTHACIIKSLFAAEKYEAAYKHVVDASAVDKTCSNMIYSLMAKLYLEKGLMMSARDTLVDMMEKGLKPEFSIYVKIVKKLRRTGRGNLARELESMHSKFVFNPHVACR